MPKQLSTSVIVQKGVSLGRLIHYVQYLHKRGYLANKTVRILARVTTQPDKIEELRSLLPDLVKETRRENGCINYQLFQNKSDPGDFTFVENGRMILLSMAHFATTHL